MLRFIHFLLASIPLALWGCAGLLSEPVWQPFSPTRHRQIHVQSCVDQSANRGQWNLAPEASRALMGKVLATRRFEFAPEPALIFSCDVEGHIDRSDPQRNFPPLWGLSEVRVTVIAWERPGDRVMAVFRGLATLPRGGIDNVGTESRLIAAAMNDVANQLEAWINASGKAGP